MGSVGSTTGLHYDAEPMSILHQLAGVKRVTLYHPSDTPLLYPGGRFYPYTENSHIDTRLPPAAMLSRWPRFGRARPITVTLSPGDALFIPAYWWHTATVVSGTSISVSKMARSTCQAWSLWPEELFRMLHELGLYRRSSCICHPHPVYQHEGSPYWANADSEAEDDGDQVRVPN
jgi:hypothetical protein